ncbi:MAG: ParM/StbA family protein [Richelia sp. SL_2_1]|nr:ParM/StbA family protein [Richelia sp. SM1_7_0]NJO31111.1 ParM/StbA family protein [Richelia sp. SL_2_1]
MKLIADIGNYSTITATENSEPLVIRAVSADITVKSVMTANTDVSPTVEVDGKRLILGDYATKQKNAQTIVERGKFEPGVVKPYLFAGLHSDFTGEVLYLIPEDDRWIKDGLYSKLIGTHEVKVNGKSYKHTFKSIKFFLESDVAVEYAFSEGLIDTDGDCLAVDIGGGTCIYLVMTPSGQVLHRRSIPDVGGISLCYDIINSNLMRSYKYAFKPAKVMDAIADGSLMYGRKYDFSEVYQPLLDDWFNRLINAIQMDCRDLLSDVTTIMFLGGNANLLRDRIANQPGYYIPENPQLTNIQALMNL